MDVTSRDHFWSLFLWSGKMYDGSLAKHLANGFEEDGEGKLLVPTLLINDDYLTEEFPSKSAEHGRATDEQWGELFDDIAAMVDSSKVLVERVDTRAIRLWWIGEQTTAEEAVMNAEIFIRLAADRKAIRAKHADEDGVKK